MRTTLFVIVLAAALSGCAAVKSYKNITTERYTFPEINSTATRSVGDKLIEHGFGELQPFIIVHEEKKFTGGRIPIGRHQYDADTKEETWFYSDNYNIYFYILKATGQLCTTNTDCTEVKYTTGKSLTSRTQNSFQQTLLFNGKIGNRVTLAYREFQDGLARPAFSNSVDFDLSESKIIGYKGARLEVINATGTEITYRLLSGFQ